MWNGLQGPSRGVAGRLEPAAGGFRLFVWRQADVGRYGHSTFCPTVRTYGSGLVSGAALAALIAVVASLDAGWFVCSSHAQVFALAGRIARRSVSRSGVNFACCVVACTH